MTHCRLKPPRGRPFAFFRVENRGRRLLHGLHPDEMITSSMRARARRPRVSKIHTGGGKKVGCPACFVVRYPNPSFLQSMIPGGPSIDGFVRVAWSWRGTGGVRRGDEHASEQRCHQDD